MRRLEDGRTVAHYNLRDGDIIETTSNPFFVTCMYILAIEAKMKYAVAGETADKTMQALMKKSYIRKYTILGILMNSSKDDGDTQPPHFDSVPSFINFVHNHSKKGAEMSKFTEESLLKIFQEFVRIDQLADDPVSSLVSRYRERMELHDVQGNPDEDPEVELSDRFISKYLTNKVTKAGAQRHNKEQENGLKCALPNNRPRSKRKIIPLCDNCDATQSDFWCPSCDGGQGMALCTKCSNFLHLKRKHDLLPASEAPKHPKTYIPQAYRAPFALLIGLFKGHIEEEKRISMQEEELRSIAQGLTDTDLCDKSPGKMFGGFESIETLITKGIVKREATQHPTYALSPHGIDLAKRLLKFHLAVMKTMEKNIMPTVPSCASKNSVVLVIDEQERKKARMVELTQQQGLKTEIRTLSSGDYIWIVRYADQEMVLPCIIERKTWDDLHCSMQDNRFNKQIQRMKRLPFRNKFYLIEGNISDMRSKPSPDRKEKIKQSLENLILNEGFKVNYTGSWFKTAAWLSHLTGLLADALEKDILGPLVTYSEYSRIVQNNAEGHNEIRPNRKVLCHHWKAKEYVDILLESGNKTPAVALGEIESKLGVNLLNPLEQHILIIEGLEGYNKGRQKCLNDCLNFSFSDMNKPVKELVIPKLESSLTQLVHYDLQQYYSLLIQVNLDVYVVRKENPDDVRLLMSKIISSDSQSIIHKEWGAGFVLGTAEKVNSLTTTVDQHESEDDMDADLRKALALSLIESGPGNILSPENSSKILGVTELGIEIKPHVQMKNNVVVKGEFEKNFQEKFNRENQVDNRACGIKIENEYDNKPEIVRRDNLEVNPPLQNTAHISEDEAFARLLQRQLNSECAENEQSIANDELVAEQLQVELNQSGHLEDNIHLRGHDKLISNPNSLDVINSDSHTLDDETIAKQLQEELNKTNKGFDITLDEQVARRLQLEMNSQNNNIDNLHSRGSSQFSSQNQLGEHRLMEVVKHMSFKAKLPRAECNNNSKLIGSIPETYTPSSARERHGNGSSLFKNLKKERTKQANQIEEYRKLQKQRYDEKNLKGSNRLSATTSMLNQNNKRSIGYSNDFSSSSSVVVLDSDSDDEDLQPVLKKLHAYPTLSPALKEEPQGNMKCGACHGKGHNRRWNKCPQYYSSEEMERREKEKRNRTAQREQKKREQEEVIAAFEAERNGLVEEMRVSQERFQAAINNVSTILNTVTDNKTPKQKKKKK